MSAAEIALAVLGVLVSVAVALWVLRRNTEERVDVELEARLAQAPPSPVIVTVVRRPSIDRRYLVLVTNPTRTETSAAGRPLPTLPSPRGAYAKLEAAERRADQLRRYYALLQLPDEPVAETRGWGTVEDDGNYFGEIR